MYGPSKNDIYWANKQPFSEVKKGADSSSVDTKVTVPFFQTPKTRVEVKAQSTDMTATQIAFKSLTKKGQGDLAVQEHRLLKDIEACDNHKAKTPEIKAEVDKVKKGFEEQLVRVQSAQGKGKK